MLNYGHWITEVAGSLQEHHRRSACWPFLNLLVKTVHNFQWCLQAYRMWTRLKGVHYERFIWRTFDPYHYSDDNLASQQFLVIGYFQQCFPVASFCWYLDAKMSQNCQSQQKDLQNQHERNLLHMNISIKSIGLKILNGYGNNSKTQ